MSDPQNTPGTKPPRKGRGLKIALAVSLALNLAIVGLVAGVALGRDGPGRDGPPRLHSMGLGPFALALSREDRDRLRDRIGTQADGMQSDRRAIGMALREVQAALRAQPFDRAAAEAALARSRMASEALQARGHGALLDYLEQMTAEDRAELANTLERRMRGFGGARRN